MMIGVHDIGKIGVLAFALNTSVAFADMSEGEMQAVAVSYAELDLSKPAGAEVLYDRLQRAAVKVCGLHDRSSSSFYALATKERKACYEDALSRAVAKIDAPLVKEQHAG
ncbi:MAG: UrcA family protein [Pseudomonadaceae bacterium]|nr:UrcA family protein [Pseudomonadaceae bacterium]